MVLPCRKDGHMKTMAFWMALVLMVVSFVSSAADCVYSQVSAGLYHTLAVKVDGTVWAWGRNQFGQMGIVGIDSTDIPVQVVGLVGIIKVDAGDYYSLALDGDGRVWS